MEDFGQWNVPKLKMFLKEYFINYSGYRKAVLVSLCRCVREMSLEKEPVENTSEIIAEKLLNIGLADPFLMDVNTFTTDLSGFGLCSLFDIFNHLIYSVADYDKSKLNAYKSMDDYRLYIDGHVIGLCVKSVGEYSIFLANVKPTQREKTYLDKTSYRQWIVCQTSGAVELCYCECKGGSDGACRHVSAVLYEIESYNERVKSVTDGPVQWVKRARQSDEPAPVKKLQIKKAKFGQTLQPQHVRETDVRNRADREQHSQEKLDRFAEGLRMNDSNTSVLELLEAPPPEEEIVTRPQGTQWKKFCVQSRVSDWWHSVEIAPGEYSSEDILKGFWGDVGYSELDVLEIQGWTMGQSGNSLWGDLRAGLVTASKAKRVKTRTETFKRMPSTDMSAVLGEVMGGNVNIASSGPRAYGSSMEATAAQEYVCVEKRRHTNLHFNESGLVVSTAHPLTGCSPDGVVTCDCTDHANKWLVEVKCPYNNRFLHPRDAMLQSCGFRLVQGKPVMNPNHQYYHQIQMQMGITGIHQCDFVVYTKKGIHVETVTYNEEQFNKMMSTINDFITEILFPELLKRAINNV